MKITPKFLIVSAFNLLIFSVPLYFRFVNEELFEFNKMILVYALTIIIGFLWVLRMIFEKRLIIKKTPLDLPILAFLFSQFISTIFSIHPYTSWFGYYSRFNGGLFSTISYIVLFYAFVSNINKKDLGSFFLSTFASGLLVSLYGILEHFGHSLSCLFVAGNRSFGVDCWVQDVQSRVFASFGQPNWLAAYVITLFPLSFIATIQHKLPIAKRILFLITTLALFLVLLYTRSRSGILGLGVGLVIFALGVGILYLQSKKELFKKFHFPSLGIIALCIFGFVLFNGTSFTPSVLNFIQEKSIERKISLQPGQKVGTDSDGNIQIYDAGPITIGGNQNLDQDPQPTQTPEVVVNRLDQGGTDSGEIRKIVWTGAFKVWQRYPIIGSGVETFAYSYYQDRTIEHNNVSEWDFLYNKAHNELLNLMATTGTIGLITYLSIFIVITIMTVKISILKKYEATEKLIALALYSGQIALFISNFFGFSTVAVNVLMYLYFAITAIIYSNVKEDKESVKNKKRTTYVINEGSQYFGLTLVGIITLVLLFRVYNYWAADKAYAQGKNYFNAGQYQYGIQEMLESISRSPNEALFFDTLSDDYAKLAVHFANIGEATAAAQMAEQTVAASNETLKLNDRHLNFYKTRARVMVTLSQLDEMYLEDAKATLLKAMQLSPTDPKLVYTLAVIEHTNENLEEAVRLYNEAITLKPDYERPYLKLSEVYQSLEQYDKAIAPLETILEHISPGNAEVLERISVLKEMQANQK